MQKKENIKKEDIVIKKISIKKVIIILTIIIIALFLLIVILSTNRNDDTNKIITNTTVNQEKREEKVTDYVRTRPEKERMQTYLAEFIKHLERKEYAEAYGKLYDKFKTNYFPTLDSFTEYAKKYYSDLMTLDYEDIQRQGKYYILTVVLKDMGITHIEKTQMYVIYENGINDYYISFQVQK